MKRPRVLFAIETQRVNWRLLMAYKITVTSYDLVGSVPNTEDDTVVAQALFGYIQNETGRVYQIKHTQVWWFDDELKQWFLDSDMPDFKLD